MQRRNVTDYPDYKGDTDLPEKDGRPRPKVGLVSSILAAKNKNNVEHITKIVSKDMLGEAKFKILRKMTDFKLDFRQLL